MSLWTGEVKVQIVMVSLTPGAIVSGVAQRCGLTPQYLSAWRNAVPSGLLSLRDPPAASEQRQGAPSMVAQRSGTTGIEGNEPASRRASGCSATRPTARAFAVWSQRPGIAIERIKPGQPQQKRPA